MNIYLRGLFNTHYHMDVFELVRLNMKRIRLARGLSQEEIAARMGIKQPNYSRMELGESKPTLQTLVRLCEALECDVPELFYKPDQIELMEQVRRIEALGKKKRTEVVTLLDLALVKGGQVDENTVTKRKARLRTSRHTRSS